MITFKVWTVIAVFGESQVPLKSWSATEETAMLQVEEWSETFHGRELDLRSEGKLFAIFKNGNLLQAGGAR